MRSLSTDDVRTLFHELAHAAYTELDGGLKGGQHAEQKVISEFTTCVLAEMYEYDCSANAKHIYPENKKGIA